MVELKGNIVATYRRKGCTVYIRDAAYAGKSEAELERVRLEARWVACDIIDRAVREGRLDPVTGELLDPTQKRGRVRCENHRV